MTIERSHGKARPTLPRASDLQVPALDAVAERTHQRDAAGRFVAGHGLGKGRGWKRAVAKLIGRAADDPAAVVVAGDAWKLYVAKLRELPHSGPTVRSLAAQGAREEALAAFWHTEASARGLTTTEGIAASDRAMRHGQRAERLAVTALDIATKLAAADATKPVNPEAFARMMQDAGKPRAREGGA